MSIVNFVPSAKRARIVGDIDSVVRDLRGDFDAVVPRGEPITWGEVSTEAGPSTSRRPRLKERESRSRTTTEQVREEKRYIDMTSNTVSRRRLRTGRQKRPNVYSLKKHVIGAGDEYVYRWQQTSPSYLGPGKLSIGWSATGDTDQVPIHFMSLTTNPKGAAHAAKGCYKSGMHRMYYDRVQNRFGWYFIPATQANGSDNATGYWEMETGADRGTWEARSVFHKYTQIKINLYGTYSVPINYRVFLCQMKEEVDPTQYALAGTPILPGSECYNMFKDWYKTLTYSSVGNNNGRQSWQRNVRIIKQYSTTIQPLTYSDQEAEIALEANATSTTPHIRELRWFVRHDRFRDYKWSENAQADAIPETLYDTNLLGGWDVNRPLSSMSDLPWGKKLFLVIMASSPVKLTTWPEYPFQTATPTKTQGSYDICVRNCFRYFDAA